MIKREKEKKKRSSFSLFSPRGDVYQERHGGSDMKGIQVSIDVSESEIVPKAFQRPAVSRGPGSRCLCECVFSGRQAQKISSHKQGGRRREAK